MNERKFPSPLTDLKVVDFSRYLPGPFCALQLAWLGAEVTAIEHAPDGDPMRHLPPLNSAGVSRSYASLRRDTAVELLDLSVPTDLQAAHSLCADADVVIEGFRPGVAARFGIDAASLRDQYPRLIHCSISGFGQDGPWRDTPAHDINYEAVSGLLDRSGSPDEIELPPVPTADMAGGAFAATAICAALYQRSVTNSGATIDLSLAESALTWQMMQFSDAVAGDERRGKGMLTGGAACYDTYRCSDDRWVAIGPIEPKFFTRMCALVKAPELTEMQWDPAQQELLRSKLAAIFRQHSAEHWEQLLGGADGGCCVTKVLTAQEASEHDQFQFRGAVDQTGGQAIPASPFRIQP